MFDSVAESKLMKPKDRYRSSLKYLIIALVLLVFGGSGFSVAAAQSDTGWDRWDAGKNMRIELLGVQWAIAGHDTQGAQDHLATAFSYYEQTLRPLLQPDLSNLVTALDADFAAARDQIKAADALGLAQSTSSLWTHFLQAATDMTFLTIQRNDARSASDWLLLREPRSADSKTGSRLDASAEIYALMGKRRDPVEVYNGVHAELFDAYQEKLNEALTKADGLVWDNASASWVEQAALASGYFGIVASSFAEQRGEAALSEMQTDFVKLTHAALAGDRSSYVATRQLITNGLKGFVAAPYTDLELSRSAGLMMRYLTLIPVEYTESVKDGEVISDSDYQQAVVYLQQSRVSFGLVQPTVEARLSDTQKKALSADFDQLDQQIQNYAAVEDIQNSVFNLTLKVGDMLPLKWRSVNSTSDIQAIRVVLDQVQVSVRSGEYEAALASCVGAYGVLQQTLGQKLLAFAPDIALKLDALLWQGEPGRPGLAVLIASKSGVGEIEQEIGRLNAVLDEAEFVLSGTSSPQVVLGNTAIIVFREGLEAILILVALLGNLRAASAHRIRYALLIGAILACVAAALTGWLVTRVLNAFVSQQNQLVAVVSLLAVLVMLLIMNWFFHRVYWTRHLSILHTRKARSLAVGSTAGILTLGFISVYREAFETALFLQPLTLTAGSQLMLLGLIFGLVALLMVGVLIFALNQRLPYKYMLILTAVLMVLVLVNMVGKTVYAFQIVNWMPISPIGLVYIPRWLEDWLGVYPTWQGLVLQLAAACFVVGSYFWAEHLSKNRREHKRLQHEQQVRTAGGNPHP